MNTIFKYQLQITNRQILKLPLGARILTAQLNEYQIQIWAEVDGSAPLFPRVLWIVGTGKLLPTVPVRYIATVQKTPFVWHVYEEMEVVV